MWSWFGIFDYLQQKWYHVIQRNQQRLSRISLFRFVIVSSVFVGGAVFFCWACWTMVPFGGSIVDDSVITSQLYWGPCLNTARKLQKSRRSCFSFLSLIISSHDNEWTSPLHLLIVFPHPMSPLVKLFKSDSLAKYKNAKIAIDWRMYMKAFHNFPSEKSKSGVRRTNHTLVELLRNVLLPLQIVSIQMVSDNSFNLIHPHSSNELFVKVFLLIHSSRPQHRSWSTTHQF